MFKLSRRSLNNLKGVNPALVEVVKRAIEITEEDFSVIEGLRTLERQKILFAKGASKTLNSRHLSGNAVDLALWKGGTINWVDYEGYKAIGKAMLEAANELGVEIRWGADWDGDGSHEDETFLDWVHFELPYKPKKSFKKSD